MAYLVIKRHILIAIFDKHLSHKCGEILIRVMMILYSSIGRRVHFQIVLLLGCPAKLVLTQFCVSAVHPNVPGDHGMNTLPRGSEHSQTENVGD